MRRDRILSEQNRQMMRNALREAARVHKNEGRAILFHEACNARVNFFPHLIGSYRPKFARGNLHREINFSALRNVHKNGLWSAIADEELPNEFHRLLRRRKADARGRFICQSFKAFERKCEVRATFIVGDRMNFINNHRLDSAKQLAAFSRSKQNIKKLRRCYQNMRWPLLHGQASASERIPASHGRADFRHQVTLSLGQLEDLAKRYVEVSLDIVAEGF